MQNAEHKADGDKACRIPTEGGSLQQVTPQIKHAAAALASLIRNQDGTGEKMRASALSAFLSMPKSSLGDLTPSDGEVDEVSRRFRVLLKCESADVQRIKCERYARIFKKRDFINLKMGFAQQQKKRSDGRKGFWSQTAS